MVSSKTRRAPSAPSKASESDLSEHSSEADFDDSDDSDDDDEPPQSQLSLGTPMPSRGDTPGVRTLALINGSSQLLQAGATRPSTPSVRRKRALTRTTLQNARKKKKNNAGAPPPRSQTGSQALRKQVVTWSQEEVAQLMLWYLDCTRDGLFTTERANIKKAWKYTLEKAQAMWLEKDLTEKSISTKYHLERKKWRDLMELMTSDTVWERFWATHPKASRSIATKPISDHEVYSEVYAHDRSVGSMIMEPTDIIRARDQEAEGETN
ncbi:hypothetical protein B0H67DRAFT_673605 [Lasiosphaeris hirsuta]|uniref:Myb/SANT-like domain-containing protein n=1 Tax=Lasiosphaeris hirsuta TaxID=260670 RepID=A0AA39ZVZ2_9PEZI|nr:hypothetical protein B0H67DRAFT_673605 [Lasiosphaeris hirsuta]